MYIFFIASVETVVMMGNFYLFQARFLLFKVNPTMTHNNMYAWGGVSSFVILNIEVTVHYVLIAVYCCKLSDTVSSKYYARNLTRFCVFNHIYPGYKYDSVLHIRRDERENIGGNFQYFYISTNVMAPH